jgi:Domain of unknown function (DUF4440)
MKFTLTLFLLLGLLFAQAQEKKVAPTSLELFSTIKRMDSLLFLAFNTQNLTALKSYFTNDLEWFQDNGGLIKYTTVFKNFGTMFKNKNILTRQLIEGSLEVHPIKNYGAIEIGAHQFKHIENGKEEVGTFKFLMIWKLHNKVWKISRVVSYDH